MCTVHCYCRLLFCRYYCPTCPSCGQTLTLHRSVKIQLLCFVLLSMFLLVCFIPWKKMLPSLLIHPHKPIHFSTSLIQQTTRHGKTLHKNATYSIQFSTVGAGPPLFNLLMISANEGLASGSWSQQSRMSVAYHSGHVSGIGNRFLCVCTIIATYPSSSFDCFTCIGCMPSYGIFRVSSSHRLIPYEYTSAFSV